MIMKTVGVRFVGSSTYVKTYYYLTDDMSIDVDDYCLVIDAQGVPFVVRVNDSNATDPTNKATKTIMQKIDTSQFFEKQNLIAERAAKMKRLEQISKEAYTAEKFKILESYSEEAKHLLRELGIVKIEESK